ncbi:hypothetical protein GIB67_040561 [Kingdonia uniflora]|uniref:Protein kinase domain-containing protein n=1 Tax=Kingdonia uniflora TaxID=39325 RepID=A0A7J7L5J3_9MAGN|nr:hypothetical protein GIB67_040561 [Kingdonia uniflora]
MNTLSSTVYYTAREFNDEHGNLRDDVAGLPREFRYEDLKTATKNFKCQLGSGGSGAVFKGILDDGTLVAVKRVEREVYGELEFKNELSAIASAQHFNLILHLEIKPENILVGDDFRGVLSDFGMCKLISRDDSRFHTITRRGTRDYMAPEWNLGHGKTEQTDIFSFGKLRRSIRYINKKLKDGKVLDLIDKRLMVDGSVEESVAANFVCVAIQCLKEDPQKRPCNMWEVFSMLEPVLAINGKGVRSGNLYALVGKSVGEDVKVACTGGAMEISRKWNLVQGGEMTRSTK